MRMTSRSSVMKVVIPLALLAGAGSCGGVTPTNPSSSDASRYDGQWSGATFQGRPITFTVSSDQQVTSITVEYSFNGCSGSNTFSNLSLAIGNPPNPSSPSLGPSFGYGSGAPEGANYTQVYGTFTSSSTAIGSVIFGAYTGCGTAIGAWSATKNH